MVTVASRILTIAGTRPEAIKIAPLILAARGRAGLDHRLLATGQQAARFDEALAEFGLGPDLRLDPVAYHPDPDAMVARQVAALIPVIETERPDMVLVQGDTSSALAGATAAHRLGIPVGHVEAGLRSGDLGNPWPEERNRIAIDAIATLLFAPTDRAVAALATDPAARGAVFRTGNTGIDAVLWMRGRIAAPPSDTKTILLTCHRRESFGAGIARICAAVLRLADRGDVRILCPLHDNPAAGEAVRAMLGRHAAITLAGALSYAASVAAMASARIILTDSGGIQEEAPALGIPTLVLRDTTERQEGIDSGNLRLVGTDPERIVAAAGHLLDDSAAHARMARPAFPFGDGRAAIAILDLVERYFSQRHGGGDPLHFGRVGIMDGAPTGV
jgi:UDP-N-acetylglucosamine 2-epimerase (non-hydrolysing)